MLKFPHQDLACSSQEWLWSLGTRHKWSTSTVPKFHVNWTQHRSSCSSWLIHAECWDWGFWRQVLKSNYFHLRCTLHQPVPYRNLMLTLIIITAFHCGTWTQHMLCTEQSTRVMYATIVHHVVFVLEVPNVWSALVAFQQNTTIIQCDNIVVHVAGSPLGLVCSNRPHHGRQCRCSSCRHHWRQHRSSCSSCLIHCECWDWAF